MSDYPEETDLEKIKEVKPVVGAQLDKWLDFALNEVFNLNYGSVREKGGIYRVATGGWSGNEDVIAAMRSNSLAWFFCYRANVCGGLWIFRKADIHPELEEIVEAIKGWRE